MSEHDDTPLMRQYREIKRGYSEAILFFRVGDFYEMFYEDAEAASRLLSIALTSRDKSSPDPVPLCGVPYHAAQGYIAKLLKAGRTVALCEQVEDPKLAKGLVRREVVRADVVNVPDDSEPGQRPRPGFVGDRWFLEVGLCGDSGHTERTEGECGRASLC